MSEDQTVNSASVDQHEENKLVALRREKLAELRQQGKAFPNKFRRDALTGDLQAEFKDHDKPSLEALAHHVKPWCVLRATRYVWSYSAVRQS